MPRDVILLRLTFYRLERFKDSDKLKKNYKFYLIKLNYIHVFFSIS